MEKFKAWVTIVPSFIFVCLIRILYVLFGRYKAAGRMMRDTGENFMNLSKYFNSPPINE